jgi:hypothetical protein
MTAGVLGKSQRPATFGGPENGPMFAVRASLRRIEPVPALLVVLLNDCGKLPPIPNLPRAGVLGFREPRLDDMESASWVAAWDGSVIDPDGLRKVDGLASFRDYWDFHTASDVREICSIRGSRRAVVALVRYLRDDAEIHDRRLVGNVERHDCGLTKLLVRLGARPVDRARLEYAP